MLYVPPLPPPPLIDLPLSILRINSMHSSHDPLRKKNISLKNGRHLEDKFESTVYVFGFHTIKRFDYDIGYLHIINIHGVFCLKYVSFPRLTPCTTWDYNKLGIWQKQRTGFS